MSKKISNAKIYKLINNYNDDIYIGSTCKELKNRYNYHKHDSEKEYNKQLPLYKWINEIGFHRFSIELIEEYPCKNQCELNKQQGYYIRQDH